MNMTKKGISPLIAAVLLIAFTMAIASIFAQWAPQLMDDATGDTEDRAAEIQDCTQIQMEIVDVDYEGDNHEVTVRQTAGEAGAGQVSVSWFYEDDEPQQETSVLGFDGDDEDFDPESQDDIESLEDNPRDSFTIEPENAGGHLEQVSLDPVDCEGAGTTSWSR